MERSHALIGMELGPCTLVQLLGQGSTGAVFLADHVELQEQVAVKVVAPPASPFEPFDLASFLARFRRAASSASTLAHPHILPVIEYGVQNGLGYLVMPYLNLEPFDVGMRREGPIEPSAAAGYLDQLTSALTYAHKLGILHGNIAPSNILLRQGKTLVLSDFGQGMALHTPVRQAESVSQTTRISPYRAPEQLLGGRVDERTDLYALGVLLFELLTGTPPYSGTKASELLMQQLQQSPPSPREIRPEVSEGCALVIVRALAREPSQRFARIEELAEAFHQAAASGRSDLSAPTPRPSATPLLSTAAEKRIVDEQENGQAATPFLPSAQAEPEEHVFPDPLPAFPATEDSESAHLAQGKRESAGATTHLVQVLASCEDDEKAPPVSRATSLQSEDERHLSAPSSTLSPVSGALLPQGDRRLIAQHTWPIRRRSMALGKRRQSRFLAIGVACLLVVVVTGSLLWGSVLVPHMPQAARTTSQIAPSGQMALFSDPLTKASHSQWWPTAPTSIYTFTQSAYRITSAGLENSSAVLVTPLWAEPITYSITAQAISPLSSSTFFGILFRCNSQNEEGSPQACYSFEVTGSGFYRFYKYDALTFDERQAGPTSEWSLLWQRPIGPEFHSSPGATNTLSVVEGQLFTLLVNGKHVGQVTDTSFHSGMIGMIVGGPGTVIAFSRLLVTRT